MNDELILVTGASSYLGLHIVDTFLRSNFKVRGTIRSFDKRLKVQSLFSLEKSEDNLEVIEADLLDSESWNRVLEDITIVIHCASPHPKKKPIDDDLLIQPAVRGTRNVLSAAFTSKTVKKFILTSAFVSVSGYSLVGKKYDESDWADPDKHVGYVKSKILCEKTAWDFMATYKPNFDLIVINPGFLLGPTLHLEGTETGTSEARIVDLFKGKLDVIPRFNFGVCDVRDAASAHFKAALIPNLTSKRFIIASQKEYISMKNIVDIINEEFNELGIKLSFSKKEDTNGFLSQAQLDNSRMVNELCIEPINVRSTICDMVLSLIQNEFIKIENL